MEARGEALAMDCAERGRVEPDPSGVFYALAVARCFGHDSLVLNHARQEKTAVVVTPGVDFGQSAEGMLRFSCAVEPYSLEGTLQRRARVLPEWENARQDSRKEEA